MGSETIKVGYASASNMHPAQVVIFTAIQDLEAKALHRQLEALNATELPPTNFERRRGFRRWKLRSALPEVESLDILTKCFGRAGNGFSAVELSELLYSQMRPSLICFCGIGGSLGVKDAPLGSVIVGTGTSWRGFDKISGDSISEMARKVTLGEYEIPDNLRHLLSGYIESERDGITNTCNGSVDLSEDGDLFSKIKVWFSNARKEERLLSDLEGMDPCDYAGRKKPSVSFGRFMSWDYVLNEKDLRDKIKKDDDTLSAVEMETGGMQHALRRALERYNETGRSALLNVRGISDLCNCKSDDVFREVAADHSAAFLVGFLSSAFDPKFYISD